MLFPLYKIFITLLLLFSHTYFAIVQAETTLPIGSASFRSDAPSRYTVINGDNLLDVLGIFIRNAWQHLEELEKINFNIHPGDVILKRANSLVLGKNRTVKLSPNIRVPRTEAAINKIPIDQIRQFLIRPMIIDNDELSDAAYVLSTSNGKVLLSTGDVFYARGIDTEIEDIDNLTFSIIKPGQIYTDSAGGSVLAYEAIHLGEATLKKEGDPATLVVTTSIQEIKAGDRLLMTEKRHFDTDLFPHAPEDIIEEGEIIAVVNGVSQIGQYQVVVINKGEQDYLERGHILGVFRGGEIIQDRFSNNEVVQLPSTRAGTLLIFKVFDKISFGLITNASQTIYVRDKIDAPY